MGLNIAIKAHNDGDHVLAQEHYKRAIQQGVKKPLLYQNYGALLRSMELIDESISCYKEGLKLFPNHTGIAINFANVIRDRYPVKSLCLYLQSFRFIIDSDLVDSQNSLPSLALNIVTLLRELSLYAWAYEALRFSLNFVDLTSQLALQLLLLIDESESLFLSTVDSTKIVELVLSRIDCESVEQRVESYFGLASHYANKSDFKLSSDYFAKAATVLGEIKEIEPKLQSCIDVHYWNYANHLLKAQRFDLGWKLFDYGLRAPSSGQQRWQRALAKPFSYSDLSIWKGEDLTNSRLLVLDEQGIGDVMMFVTLLPKIIDEARFVGLLLNDRLYEIYQRSFASYIDTGKLVIYRHRDCHQSILQASSFDFQCPMGSVCQYRYNHPSKFGFTSPILISDKFKSSTLKKKYLNCSSNQFKLIGISWQGGGKSGRIRQKSLPLQKFIGILQGFENCKFVSLQYGDCTNAIKVFSKKGIEVIYDQEINPLKDMNAWLNQVDACDAVLSVANTTIHGAGGLLKPTLCLLSKHFDWRWLSSTDVQRSYWYPTVGIAREADDCTEWDSACEQAREWIARGCPAPTGRAYN